MQNCIINQLTPVHLSDAHNLSTLAGWNQTPGDWERLLKLQPDGCYAALCDGHLIGTVTTTEYERRFGWIGMVLVHPDYRGGGTGKQLLRTGIDSLQRHGIPTIKLDATPLGEPLYAKAGFQVESTLERWEGMASPPQNSPATTTSFTLTTGVAGLSDEVSQFDRQNFGADRRSLLQSLAHDFPAYCLICHDRNGLCGYIMGRHGQQANYLGPWLATSSDVAQYLFDHLLTLWAGQRIFVDVNTLTPARSIVQASGLTLQRSLRRMYLGPNDFPGHPDTIYGIAGPEIG